MVLSWHYNKAYRLYYVRTLSYEKHYIYIIQAILKLIFTDRFTSPLFYILFFILHIGNHLIIAVLSVEEFYLLPVSICRVIAVYA